MNNIIKTRFTNAVYDGYKQQIFLIDDRGILYCFDEKLNLVKQSLSNLNGVTLHGISHDKQYVYTRDVAGNIICWDKFDLSSKHFLVSQHFVSPEHAEQIPAPNPSHAITATQEQLIFCNAVGGLSFIDKANFAFVKSLEVSENAFLEHLSVSPCGGKLFINDISGALFVYDLADGSLTKLIQLNSGVSHSVVYDNIHHRFLVTSDVSGGVYLLTQQGDIIDSLRFTNDDVEEIILSQDGARFYVCCFDHYIYVFENAVQPKLLGKIGQFKFQINHLKSLNNNTMLALLESGEAYIICGNTYQIISRCGGTSAYWELTLQDNVLIGTSESGIIDLYEINSQRRDFLLNKISQIQPKLEPQRLRITNVCPNGDYISVRADGIVVKFGQTGDVLWTYHVHGILRDLAISPCGEKVAVCSELGEVAVLEVSHGSLIKHIKQKRPVWCIAYCKDGSLVFGERELRETEQHRTASNLIFLDRNYNERGRISSFGNFKRIRVLDEDTLLVSSNTNEKVLLVSASQCKLKQNFTDWQINTPENAAVFDDKLFVITYGFQLITYDLSNNKTLDVQYVLEGYPKGLCVYINDAGIPFLVLSCRNAIMSFCIETGEPELVSNRYLNDSQYNDHLQNVSFQPIQYTAYQLTTNNITEYNYL